MKSSPHFCRKDRNVGSLLIFLRFSLLHYYFNINLLRVRTIWAAAFVLCLLAWRIPRPLRLGDRKFVPANHPPDGLLSLFAHLSEGTLRVPLLRGPAPAPPPGLRFPLRSAPCLCATGARRPFEKGGRKLYVFDTFGAVVIRCAARQSDSASPHALPAYIQR